MVRFMALDRVENMGRTGVYYFSWSIFFLVTTLLVGLATRLFITESGGFDAELALPTLAGLLLPGLAVGIILGGIFAATMSTTDSQILSCSAVLSEDFNIGTGVWAKRLATVAVTLSALAIGLFATANVFTLVIYAWSALGCSIGPLVITHALGARPTEKTALVMLFTGLATALSWRYFGFNAIVYEGLPGMASSFMVFGLGQLIGHNPAHQ